jgi:hypothetical protein
MSSRLGIAQRLDPKNRVKDTEISLQTVRQSVTATLMKDAVLHAGIDPQSPGKVEQYYLRDEQLLVIDLGGHYKEKTNNEEVDRDGK